MNRVETYDKLKLIEDITRGNNGRARLLENIYEVLSLSEVNAVEQYAVLNMFHTNMFNSEREVQDTLKHLIEMLINFMKDKDLSAILLRAEEYRWWPEEIYKLRKIRDELVRKSALYPAEKHNIVPINLDRMDRKIGEILKALEGKEYAYIGSEDIHRECTEIKNTISGIVQKYTTMEQIRGICSELEKNEEDVYLNSMWKFGDVVEFVFSDMYGNIEGYRIWYYNLNTLEHADINKEEWEYRSERCEVPEEYKSYKALIMDRLENESEYSEEDLGLYGFAMPVDALYSSITVEDVGIDQLYKVCKYIIDTFVEFCDEEEKKHYGAVIENDTMKQVLNTPLDRLVELAEKRYRE